MAKKILVVDDDLFIREIYVNVLTKAGYDVDSAANGEDGLACIKNGGYSLILLDLLMPKMTGMEVINKLYLNPPSVQNGPIILLTNSEPESVVQECIKKGASTYLTKTDLTPDQLLEKVENYLIEEIKP